MSEYKLQDFTAGDIIEFKHYSIEYDEMQMKWKPEKATIKRICKSPLPDHIPHKLIVEVDGTGREFEYGIRFDEILSHEVVQRGQTSLF